jgi:hypothetical protein
VIFLAAALSARAALAAPSFVVANDRFERDGAPFTLFSGSFHYHRALASTWADRLARMAAIAPRGRQRRLGRHARRARRPRRDRRAVRLEVLHRGSRSQSTLSRRAAAGEV